MYHVPVILELENLLTTHMNLLAQEQMSYPPFLFGTGSGSLGHYLLLHQPEQNIYSRFHYCFSHTVKKYRFLDLVIKNKRRVIAKVNLLGRIYDLDSFDFRLLQSQCIRDQIQVDYCWEFGKLEGIELFNSDIGFGKVTIEEEIEYYEKSLGAVFLREIDVPTKVEEIFNLTGFRLFFKELVDKTPCDICRQTSNAHNEDAGHEYRPFLIHTKNNTVCKICGCLIEDHLNDHEFEPDFTEYKFSDLMRPFPSIDYPY